MWGISIIVNPDIWQFISGLKWQSLLILHLFFVICFFVVLNYEYRTTFAFDRSFLFDLTKRMLFVYLSVVVGIIFLLALVHKLEGPDIFKNFLTGQSVGLMGASTFSFFKK